ncbi:hypothetical protein N7478_000286 [Penicillium angulare]|uniref:uncharacterized protein n=1 Tax=Penicillium angulare TaxID=116970 RepID=UPI0025409EF4|nr:uncharacterized protein N7478_000286 [Penicillium angulare]KAJ5291035.1 hypothetical protein N7478_000286 [Penicillium angulare]
MHPESLGNKRSACDRCRRHKLRCQRGTASRACYRCEKANAACTTGPALRSGRPIQPDSPQEQHQSTIPSQSTPSSDLENPMPEVSRASPLDTLNLVSYEDGSAPRPFIEPSNFEELDWPSILEQYDPIDFMDEVTPVTSHADIRQNNLKKLAGLQASILMDLETVKACKTADKCPEAMESFSSISPQNILVGQTLEHSTTLFDLLNYLLPTIPGTKSSNMNCDTPTLLALMSCYVSLTRIYRTIFACLLDSMPSLSGIQNTTPQIFPGMHLGGFKLEGRVDLQIQILVQISEDMICKIETKFGITDNEGTIDAPSGNPKTIQMLRLMLDEEAAEQPPLYEPRGHCRSLKEIMSLLKNPNHGT